VKHVRGSASQSQVRDGLHATSQVHAVSQAEVANEVFTNVAVDLMATGGVSAFSDDKWDLSVLEPDRAANRLAVIHFDRMPSAFTLALKRVAWTWINLKTPLELLTRKTATRSRLSPVTIANLLNHEVQWFLKHLALRNVSSFADVSAADFKSFIAWANNRGWGRDTYGRMLFSVTRLWLSAVYLPEIDRLPIPPWEVSGIEEIIGRSTWTPENKAEPIHPETMGPLLSWALSFIDEFAPDILRAIKTKEQLKRRLPDAAQGNVTQRVREYTAELNSLGAPLPTGTHRGKRFIAMEYIAAQLGVPRKSLRREYFEGVPLGVGAPLPSPIKGRIAYESEPWLDAIDYYETALYTKLLATACLIVVAYLSGMRGQEVSELRRGCCAPITHREGHPPRYKITGKEFKAALDDGGNRILGGRERENPWIVIQPVANAIQVVESLSKSSYLFDRKLFQTSIHTITEEAHSTAGLSNAIKDFVAWINDFCVRTSRPEHMIPDDPAGPVNMRRLRRTLAWFIYRQPHGRIAVGIQYGHVKSGTVDGYASRASSGLRGLYPVEDALALIDNLDEAAERLSSGEQVSGPAAKRYIDGVNHFSEKYAGKTLTHKQMTALRNNPRVRIFDDGHQPVACCYDATKALCHPDNARPTTSTKTSPDLSRCNPNCGNVARTDKHIDAIRREIAELSDQANSKVTPKPLRLRFQQRIESLNKLCDQHEATKSPTEKAVTQ